ncbi:MAG: ABC transporter ATP-binding protein [Hyphomonadaceae bacterium]|nr:ABC transporter ATP-binding protein [Hyphomonadaceae bacterium]
MSALLSLTGLGVSLAGKRVLADVGFDVNRGEVVAILGANGAGKTTVLRASLGLLRRDTGEVSLGGADPSRLSARERALRAAYLPQRPQAIWPISVEALVALGRFAHGAAPERLSPRDQAAVDAAIVACSLQPLRTQSMEKISGGEKARAHLARTLAQQASLLVLDEPDAGLDPAQSLALADILRAHAAQGGGVLITTHDVALAARAAHRIMIMKDGRVVATGTPAEAITDEALATAYGRKGTLQTIEGKMLVVFD